MTAVLRGWPRAVRVGLVVGLVAASLALVSALLVHEGEQARVNEQLYERCLSSVADVDDVKACTREFYVRRDGRLGTPDEAVVTAAERRAQTSVTTQRLADPPVVPDAPQAPDGPSTTGADVAASVGDAAVLEATVAGGHAAPAEQGTGSTETSSTAAPDDSEESPASTSSATKPPKAPKPAKAANASAGNPEAGKPSHAQDPTTPTPQGGKPTTSPSQKPVRD